MANVNPAYTHQELELRTLAEGPLPEFPEFRVTPADMYLDVSDAHGVRVYYQVEGADGGVIILRIRRFLRDRLVSFDETIRDLATLTPHAPFQTAPVTPYADAVTPPAAAPAFNGNVWIEGGGTSWMTIELAEINPLTGATARVVAVPEFRLKWQ